jgi:hypothetical protein
MYHLWPETYTGTEVEWSSKEAPAYALSIIQYLIMFEFGTTR